MNKFFQPATTDLTLQGFKIARNNMRLNLWNDVDFAHKWLCHPGKECEDGCYSFPNPMKLALYESELEN